MIETLLLATGNPHKVREVRRILPESLVRHIVTPRDLGKTLHTVEDGNTFAENAVKKAEDGMHTFGVPCLADDSGLCVDALDGAPGIFSARFAGEEATDEERTDRILELMQEHSSDRSARYICVMALAIPGQETVCFEGRCEGTIGFEKIGTEGFGYDPIFIPENMTETFAQITGEEKDLLSHRGKALRMLLHALETLS